MRRLGVLDQGDRGIQMRQAGVEVPGADLDVAVLQMQQGTQLRVLGQLDQPLGLGQRGQPAFGTARVRTRSSPG